jgi:hypothetical protein
VEGKLSSDKSDQLPFPSGNEERVTEAQAKAACAAIADPDLRMDCMTDVRMVNEPDVTDKLVNGFKTVEATDKTLGNKKSIMCGSRYGLPSTNKKANWGTDGYLVTCKRECAQDPSCLAINYEEDKKSSIWCFGCKDVSTRIESAWGLTWKWERINPKITTPTTKPPKIPKTCYSVGDPHLKQFNGATFDSHSVGWKTLYAKGNLKIQLEQAKWNTRGVAVNRAVRYSTNGGTTWDETVQDGKLLSSGVIKNFNNPGVKLTVNSADYSRFTWAKVKRIYNVYVTTSEYDGATGQCTQGKLRRRLRTSDGIEFPSGNDVKVSELQAKAACANLSEQKQNCETDLRMVNEPDVVVKMTKDFETVETVVRNLGTTTTTTTTIKTNTAKVTTTAAPITTAAETTTSAVVDSTTTTHVGFSVLVMLIVSLL